MTAFAQRLKSLRKNSGLTLKQLAQRLELTEAYLSMLESGKRHANRQLVNKIAQELIGNPKESHLHDELLILAGFTPENSHYFELPVDPLQSIQDSIKNQPADFNLFQGYVQTLIKAGRNQEALHQIEQGFLQFRDTYQLQCLLANLELAKGNFAAALIAQKAAIEQFTQSGQDNPTLLSLLYANTGGIYFQLGLQKRAQANFQQEKSSLKQAESFLLKALELDQENLFTLDEYARVCFNLAETSSKKSASPYWLKSIHAFERVFMTDPKVGLSESALQESMIFAAYARAKAGQCETAQHELALMMTLLPQDWFPRYVMACVHLLIYHQHRSKESLEQAVKWFQRSLSLNQKQALETALSDPDFETLRQNFPDLFQSSSSASKSLSKNKSSKPNRSLP